MATQLAWRYILPRPSNNTSIGHWQTSASLQQLQSGRLVAGDELVELVQQPLDAKWIAIEDDDELKLPLLER
jgi:hypothetical protein